MLIVYHSEAGPLAWLRKRKGRTILHHGAYRTARGTRYGVRSIDLNEAIVKYGAEAVQRYRTVAGLSEDNEMPEIFLGGFVACAIYDNLGVNVHVERAYTDIASELGRTPDLNIINQFGSKRADIAIYRQQRPVAVVEFKIFDDGKCPSAILADRDKMRELSHLCGIESYLGIFITDDRSGATCTQRVQTLERALDQTFTSVGARHPSINQAWHWCFASGKLP